MQSSCVNFASPWMYNGEKQVSFEQHDHIGSGCYVIQCLKDETLTIDVAGTEYTCSKEMKTVNIDFTSPVGNRYEVQLECPPYDVICGGVYGCPSNCNHRGTCKSNQNLVIYFILLFFSRRFELFLSFRFRRRIVFERRRRGRIFAGRQRRSGHR